MRTFFQFTYLLPVYSFFLIALTACGGGGGGETATPPILTAVIDANNEEKLATTATEGVTQSFEGFAIASKTISAMLDTLSCSSGTVENNYDATAGTGNITFNQCDASGILLDGTVTISLTKSGDIATFSYDINNFTFNSVSKELSFVCETIISTDKTSCIYSSTNLGLDGRIYAISDATVSKSSATTYTISAKALDPDHGMISITTVAPVLLICNGFKPFNGEIQFTDGDGKVVSVIYDSCASYTVSYSGISNSYNW